MSTPEEPGSGPASDLARVPQPHNNTERAEPEDTVSSAGQKQRHSYFSRIKQAWRQTTIGNKLVVGLTLVIAVSNLFFVIYARKQWKVMGGQLDQMAQQLPELQRAAKAAEDNARIATQQMIIDARPWMNLIPGEGVPNAGPISSGAAIGVQFTISNPGKTAAIDVKWESFNTLVRPGNFVEPRFTPMDPKRWSRNMYPPNSATPNVTLRGPAIHSIGENKRWQEGKMWEELAIRVSYRDSIDPNHPVHVTESCIYVIWSNAANPQCPSSHNYQN
ncbi:MAG: hypothetical protein ACR2IF_12405 [Terriglobales bacterium]